MDNILYTSFGRTALYLSLLAAEVRDREVIVPAFTCVTTVLDAIIQAGGIPIFADVQADSLNMNIDDLKKKISRNTRVIISHHYYGSAATNLGEIQDLAESEKITHLEDCAHSLGAAVGNVEIGSTGDMAVFSFSKNLNNPGGGSVQFKNSGLFEKARSIQRENKNFFHDFICDFDAFNYLASLIHDREPLASTDHKCKIKPSLFKRIANKALKTLTRYPKYYFYQLTENDVGRKFPVLDTRMTRRQFQYIQNSLKNLPSIIQERRNKAKKLNEVLPAFLTSFENNVFTNYTTLTSDANTLEGSLRSLGIRTRRVWPYFQNYWKKQMTPGVLFLKDHLLLVDLDTLTHDHLERIKKIK